MASRHDAGRSGSTPPPPNMTNAKSAALRNALGLDVDPHRLTHDGANRAVLFLRSNPLLAKTPFDGDLPLFAVLRALKNFGFAGGGGYATVDFVPATRIVAELIEANPRCLTSVDAEGRTPLHVAVAAPTGGINATSRSISPIVSDVVEKLVQAEPGAARIADNHGYLPLHLLCRSTHHPPDLRMLATVLDAFPNAVNFYSYPNAVHASNGDGRGNEEDDAAGITPINLLLRNAERARRAGTNDAPHLAAVEVLRERRAGGGGGGGGGAGGRMATRRPQPLLAVEAGARTAPPIIEIGSDDDDDNKEKANDGGGGGLGSALSHALDQAVEPHHLPQHWRPPRWQPLPPPPQTPAVEGHRPTGGRRNFGGDAYPSPASNESRGVPTATSASTLSSTHGGPQQRQPQPSPLSPLQQELAWLGEESAYLRSASRRGGEQANNSNGDDDEQFSWGYVERCASPQLRQRIGPILSKVHASGGSASVRPMELLPNLPRICGVPVALWGSFASYRARVRRALRLGYRRRETAHLLPMTSVEKEQRRQERRLLSGTGDTDDTTRTTSGFDQAWRDPKRVRPRERPQAHEGRGAFIAASSRPTPDELQAQSRKVRELKDREAEAARSRAVALLAYEKRNKNLEKDLQETYRSLKAEEQQKLRELHSRGVNLMQFREIVAWTVALDPTRRHNRTPADRKRRLSAVSDNDRLHRRLKEQRLEHGEEVKAYKCRRTLTLESLQATMREELEQERKRHAKEISKVVQTHNDAIAEMGKRTEDTLRSQERHLKRTAARTRRREGVRQATKQDWEVDAETAFSIRCRLLEESKRRWKKEHDASMEQDRVEHENEMKALYEELEERRRRHELRLGQKPAARGGRHKVKQAKTGHKDQGEEDPALELVMFLRESVSRAEDNVAGLMARRKQMSVDCDIHSGAMDEVVNVTDTDNEGLLDCAPEEIDDESEEEFQIYEREPSGTLIEREPVTKGSSRRDDTQQCSTALFAGEVGSKSLSKADLADFDV